MVWMVVILIVRTMEMMMVVVVEVAAEEEEVVVAAEVAAPRKQTTMALLTLFIFTSTNLEGTASMATLTTALSTKKMWATNQTRQQNRHTSP